MALPPPSPPTLFEVDGQPIFFGAKLPTLPLVFMDTTLAIPANAPIVKLAAGVAFAPLTLVKK